MKNNKMWLFALMLCVMVHAVKSSDERDSDYDFLTDLNNEDEDDYKDIQEQPVTFNEIMAYVALQYPQTDIYTGYNIHLDRKRANIIQQIIDCHRQLYNFPEHHLTYELCLATKMKEYASIQQQRQEAMAEKNLEKSARQKQYSGRPNRTMQTSDVNSDSRDDFSNDESLTSQSSKQSYSKHHVHPQQADRNQFDDSGFAW